jgi:hypothetical protein
MDFMRLRNESTLTIILLEISTEIIDPNIFVGVEALECPSTKCLRRNAVLYCSPALRR